MIDALDDEDLPEPGSFDEDEDVPAHSDLGYQAEPPAQPALRLVPPPTEAKPAAFTPSLGTGRGVCRHCQDGFDKPGGIPLFTVAGFGARTVCAKCSGKSHREVVEQTRTTIRDLKAAVAVGNSGEERSLMVTLRALVGFDQAEQTQKAINDKHNETPATGRGSRGGR